MSHELVIVGDLLLELNPHDARLVIRFDDKPEGMTMCSDPADENKYLPGWVGLHVEDFVWGYNVSFEGYYLRRFVDELDALCAEQRGSAELSNWDGTPILRMTLVGSARNRLRVEGRLGDLLWWRGDDWLKREPAQGSDPRHMVGCRFIFNSLEIPRGDATRIIREVNDYIRFAGVSCEP